MSEEMTERVIAVIARSQKIPTENVTIDSTFQDLGIDSLDGVNILFELESEFNVNIPDDGVQNMRSVRDAVDAMRRLLAGAQPDAEPAAQS